jgi:TolA-binding protein
MGYYVISQMNNARDGNLQLTRGKERGYADGTAPKDKPKVEEKPKEEKPKVEEKPKEEKPPEDAAAKDEADAGRKLKFAKELIEDGKVERAKERLEELIKRYPKTKAAAEARDILKDLDK